ncbi:hypothetical protein SCORR_v1c06050 [Spiroplasma corruscae]|uniref:Transmembrane protein n=1 Tax=Spiroplasma corruscae TaxID=216934 RepID=A0A222EPF4_9MOLU|nr:hypothetical protein SCORR_v1c06050 [Spiroplasma corruscae]
MCQLSFLLIWLWRLFDFLISIDILITYAKIITFIIHFYILHIFINLLYYYSEYFSTILKLMVFIRFRYHFKIILFQQLFIIFKILIIYYKNLIKLCIILLKLCIILLKLCIILLKLCIILLIIIIILLI